MKTSVPTVASRDPRRTSSPPGETDAIDPTEEAVPPAHVRLLTLTHYLQSLPSMRFATLGDIIGVVPEYQRFDLSTDNGSKAFKQMFERDKGHLRECGIVLETNRLENTYRIDRKRSTFKSGLDVSAREAAQMLHVGRVALADPTFLDKDELRFALTKIRAELIWGPGHADRTRMDAPTPRAVATDAPAGSYPIDNVRKLRDAVLDRKKVMIDYRDSTGKATRKRTIRPYGDFSNNAIWYVVAYDESCDDIRVFRTERIESLRRIKDTSSKPAYTIPADFDVNHYIKLPFQYGTDRFTAVFCIREPVPASIKAIATTEGTLREREDASSVWSVEANSYELASRWAIANGPGIIPLAPPKLRHCHEKALERVLEDLAAKGERHAEA